MSISTKRQKLSEADEVASGDDEQSNDSFDSSDGSVVASGSESGSEARSLNTDDEIANPKITKSRKTLKRKRRATEPSRFGATLQFLLETDAPSTQPLSLKPSVAHEKNNEKLELKAKKALQIEKKEKEDKGRVKDVIGGWGGESERALRKVAQRGVVKLFNAIQHSQSANSAVVEDLKSMRGSGKPTLAAPSTVEIARGKKGKHKDNVIGRGKEAQVEKDEFFDMLKSGGIVSRA